MPVYQVTYKSGAQQFMEMDIEEAGVLTDQMDEYACWEDAGRPNDPGYPHHRVYASSTGATLDVSAIAGFQHYITPDYAKWAASEGDADIEGAVDAVIEAVFEHAEVEEGIVTAIDRRAVTEALMRGLGDSRTTS